MKLNQQQRRALRDQGIFLVPGEYTETEIIVVNSRFIAACSPVTSAEEAKEFHQSIRAAHPSATHHVPAYLIGHGNSTLSYCSDDGEPGGSSGRPILSVLQGSGFGDIAVVVTRYFGGTKLGIGGLVRAYSGAAKEVLDLTPCYQKVIVSEINLTIPYSHYEPIKKFLESTGATNVQEEFSEIVTLTFNILSETEDQVQKTVADLTHGTGVWTLVNSCVISTVPVKLAE
jgi:uncharacterized YigZ family protein